MGCGGSKGSRVEMQEVKNEKRYGILIKTSDAYSKAGTDSTLFIEMIGPSGTTGPLKLDKFFRDDLEPGECDHFRVKGKDVGLPFLLRLELKNKFSEDEWLCESISVSVDGEKAYFPIFDWIESSLEVTTGKAMLPQKVNNKLVGSQRRFEIEKRKATFLWNPLPAKGAPDYGTPRHLDADTHDQLPLFFQREEVRQRYQLGRGIRAEITKIYNRIRGYVRPITDITDYHQLYRNLSLGRGGVPNYVDGWQTDVAFGRQVLTGITPLMLERCSSLPDHFNVTNEDVASCFPHGKTLECQMEAGKVFISDYSQMLKGLERNTGDGGQQLRCANAAGLFYVNDNKDFVPIAIQLEPNDRDYLFTPACENKHDWLLAKMYFRCSAGAAQGWVYHLLYTHSCMEIFSVALFRCLAMSHPVYKLLCPHLKTVPAINADARESLLPPGSSANQTIAISAYPMTVSVFKSFKIDDLNIPKVLKSHGTLDRDILPGYYYRDDALELWGIIKKYVTSVLEHYYKSDKDVEEDFELQDWVNEVAVEGFGWLGGDTKGMPKKLTCIEQLVEMCVIVVFGSSVQHAAVNFGQFDTYKFAPNAPLSMRLDPHKRGEGSEKRIMESLPDVNTASLQLALGYTLSSFSPNDVFLGNYPKKLFCEEAILSSQATYKEELEALEERQEARNMTLEHPYMFLLPTRIPNYIAV